MTENTKGGQNEEKDINNSYYDVGTGHRDAA